MDERRKVALRLFQEGNCMYSKELDILLTPGRDSCWPVLHTTVTDWKIVKPREGENWSQLYTGRPHDFDELDDADEVYSWMWPSEEELPSDSMKDKVTKKDPTRQLSQAEIDELQKKAKEELKKAHEEVKRNIKAHGDVRINLPKSYGPKCECGSEKAGVAGHSSWCPMHEELD